MNSKIQYMDDELRRSLNLVILGITFGMAFFVVVNGVPLAGFTRALGAGDLVYGIIMAMPVVGGVLQTFASYFIENTGKRKKILITFGFIHRLLWIPIAIIPLLVPQSHNVIRIWAVTVLITISSASNSIAGVSFFSWMGDLIPSDIKGQFFSKRSAISTASGALAGLAVGKFLDIFQGFNGFAIVFITIALFGSADILCFFWVKHPPIKVPEEKIPFLKLFLEPFHNKNYVRYIIFISMWNFSVNIAGPFFNVFMLEYLKMGYFHIFISTQIISNISTIFFIRYWGRIIDKYGNKPVMAICCSVAALLPLFWLFAAPQNYNVILILNFLSGIFWPGIDMTSVNMSIWLAPEKNRSIYVADYTLVTSICGTALAFICGGFFMEHARPLIQNLNIPFFMGQKLTSFHCLFILSFLVRLVVIRIFFKGFNEADSGSHKDIIKGMLGTVKSKFTGIGQ